MWYGVPVVDIYATRDCTKPPKTGVGLVNVERRYKEMINEARTAVIALMRSREQGTPSISGEIALIVVDQL